MSLNAGQDRLLRIAEALENAEPAQLDDAIANDFSWLAGALRTIASGKCVDIASALGVKAGRGERTNREKTRQTQERIKLALNWLFIAMEPEDQDGFGLSLEEACAIAGENSPFGLTEETIRTYWNRQRDLRESIKKNQGIFKLED